MYINLEREFIPPRQLRNRHPRSCARIRRTRIPSRLMRFLTVILKDYIEDVRSPEEIAARHGFD